MMFERPRIVDNPETEQTQAREAKFIVVGSPVAPNRALGPRRPLALAVGSGVMVLAIWVLGVLASAGAVAGSAGPLVVLPGSAASSQ